MSLYVVETDAPCKRCGETHGYVTTMCSLNVYVDRTTALWVARHVEGSKVREIDEVPLGISYTLNVHKGGRPDPDIPARRSALSRR